MDSKNEVSESSSNESTIYKNDSENCDAEINDNFSNTLNVKENNSSDLEKKVDKESIPFVFFSPSRFGILVNFLNISDEYSM